MAAVHLARVAAMAFSALLFAGCAGVAPHPPEPPPPAPVAPPPPTVTHWTLSEVVALLGKTTSVQVLESRIGPPDGTATYNPGDPKDPYPPNWRKHIWENMLLGHPPRLFSTLPVGTPALLYDLVYPDDHPAGTLVVFRGRNNSIVGWAYNRELATDEGRSLARLRNPSP